MLRVTIDFVTSSPPSFMKQVPSETDFIVVGAGVAGLRAAIALADAGRVLVLAKQELTESATQYAQGGIAVALSDEDKIGLHLQDTIEAGAGIVDLEAAKVLVQEGPDRPRILRFLTHCFCDSYSVAKYNQAIQIHRCTDYIFHPVRCTDRGVVLTHLHFACRTTLHRRV